MYRKKSKDKTSQTTIVNCVDDNMRRFAKDILSHQLPFVVYTITSTPPGRIALNEQEYEEYENVSDACRSIIDSVYVVTREDILSRGNGILRSLYRTIFPYVKSAAVLSIRTVIIISMPFLFTALILYICSKDFHDFCKLLHDFAHPQPDQVA